MRKNLLNSCHIKKLLSLSLMIMLCFTLSEVYAQERTISGTVTDESGEGIPGVTVLEKGRSNGTVTNLDGNFQLSVGNNPILVFSYVGYETKEVAVGGRSVVDVKLAEDVTQLSEVVVIGYGATTVKDATGAVTAINADDFNQGVISSPEQLLQGKTAGVQVTSISGSPGDGVQLRIRGTNSIRSGNNPLFVVDGVPLSGGTQPSPADVGFGTTTDTNPLNFINPNDIESISILKDASATAIYGSRGANGVVIITTKDGRGAGNFEFASSVSISSPANRYDLLNREEFSQGVEQFGGDPVAQDYEANTDWQDFITRTSISHKENLAYSKGFKTGSVRASLGYDNQQGILKNSYMKRLTGRVNANKTLLNDALKLELSTTYSNVNREDPPISGNAGFQGDILGAAYSANPTWPTDPDFDAGGQRSPANMLAYFQSTGTTNRFLTNLSAEYTISENLSAKATYGFDRAVGERVTLLTGDAQNAGNNVEGFGRGQLNENTSLSHLLELTMNYKQKMGNVLVDFVGGYSVQSFRDQYFWATANGFTDYSTFEIMESELRESYLAANDVASDIFNNYNNWGVADELVNGEQPSGGFVGGINFDERTFERSYFDRPAGVTVDAIAANFYDRTDYLQSYFGRGNLNISDKYLITATLRIDGSSKFGGNNKYGYFPSGAIAWKLHEEDFMPDFFNTFKLRAGYGIVGNQNGLSYANFVQTERWADASIAEGTKVTVPGTEQAGFVNPDLKWEETTQTGVGVDFGFFSERLYGSFDWYLKETTDLLLMIEPAQPSLKALTFENLDAIVENKGWELALFWDVISNSDAKLNIGGNISQNKNMVKDFAGELNVGTIYGQGLTGAYAQRLAGGHPLFAYHLRVFEGFDENGQPIGDEQKYIGKSALPEWNLGFSINGEYKNFDITMTFNGQFGHYIYNNTQNAFFTAGSINNARNVTKDVLTSGESGFAEAAVSTRFLYSGDFVRMQNFTVGYNIPMDGGFLNKLRVYVNGQNLLLITDYNGLDPEVSTSPASYELLNNLPTAGIDYTSYPRPRIFTIGLNATF